MPDGKMVPASPLTEPLVVRPTSETIIGATYAKWVQSYRDLPILINQWANVVRWEMRPRIFLRTTEFLWQEGHTVHETEAEAREETKRMLDVYETFARDHLAIPVFSGREIGERTFSRRGADALHRSDGAGPQGDPGRHLAFPRAEFCARERDSIPNARWQTGIRLDDELGRDHADGRHGDHDARDDDGLVLPPRIAPTHVVIIPDHAEGRNARSRSGSGRQTRARNCAQISYAGAPIEVEVDRRDLGGGVKNWEWIKKGVPLRVELGPRDLESGNVAVSRRDQPVKAKEFLPSAEFVRRAAEILDSIQQNLLERATKFRDAHTRVIDSKEEFYDFFTPKNADKPEIHGGFALAHWNGSREVEEQVKNDLKVTIRCIPFDEGETGQCIFTGEKSPRRVVWAKSY